MTTTRTSAVCFAACAGLLLGLSAVVPTANAQSKRAKKETAPVSGAAAAREILAITNRERAQHGLPALHIDSRCVAAISSHVTDMSRSGFLSHTGSDGRGADDRYRRHAPGSRGAGENLAYNTTGTGASFMRQWLASPGHRANILSPRYKGVGIAVRSRCAEGNCTVYAGQCFSL